MEIVAIKTTSNFGGVVILKINDEQVVSAEDYGNGLLRKATAKVRYNAKGDAYFMRQGRREYISEFIRVEENNMTNVNRIAEIINENGIKAEPKQMQKGNFTKQSIMLGDGTIRPTVYPEDYEGTDEMIAETIVKKYMNGDFAMNNVVPNFSADAFMDWKSAKENLVLCLRPVTNVETPNITKAFLDVEMYVRYMVNNEASIVVNKEHVEKWGVQPATVFKYAKENAKGKYNLKGMVQVMAEIMGLSDDELDMMGIDKDNEQMFVGTNERKVNGASMLAAGNGYFKELCRDMHTERAFILPSSIHEILIIPDKGEMSVGQLLDKVTEVNNTEVAPEDILSYNVYVYDLAKDKVKLA